MLGGAEAARRCELCGRVDRTVSTRSVLCVASLLFTSESWTIAGRWCRRCFRREAAKYSALTLLFGLWSLTGPLWTLRALYWNIVCGGYQEREPSWAVRGWNEKLRWTSFGRFFRSEQYGFLVLGFQTLVVAGTISVGIEFAAGPLVSATVWLVIGAVVGFGYLRLRKRRTGGYSGSELEQIDALRARGHGARHVERGGIPAACGVRRCIGASACRAVPAHVEAS
jgi:hypothetical protein